MIVVDHAAAGHEMLRRLAVACPDPSTSSFEQMGGRRGLQMNCALRSVLAEALGILEAGERAKEAARGEPVPERTYLEGLRAGMVIGDKTGANRNISTIVRWLLTDETEFPGCKELG